MSENFLNPYGRYDGQEGQPDSGCEHWSTEFGALRTRNGTTQIMEFCVYCGAAVGNPVAYEKLKAMGVNPNLVPVYRDQEATRRPCPVCGELAHLHVHHWAPKHLFGEYEEIELTSDLFPGETYKRRFYEYERWPKSELCPSCHERWHRIVTPDMSRQKAS